jgi:hypothetical protein
MYTTEEIKRTMEPADEPIWHGFIDRKMPDRKAARQRYEFVQDILYDWHGKLNDKDCNTREMPEELLELYDRAVGIMVKISNYEKKLSE